MARSTTADRPEISRRAALGILGASAAAIPLAACGGGGSGGSSGGTGSLALSNYDTPQQAANTKKILSAFQAQTKVAVTLSTTPGSGASVYPGQLRTQILGGKAPDIFRCWGGTIVQPFITDKQVISLDSAYAKYGWESTLSTPNIKDFTVNGVKYGLPLWASAIGVWYNKKLFAQAKAPMPTTFAEVESANAALAKAGIQPWLAGGKYGWYVMRFFEWFLEMTAGPTEHDKLRNTQTSWNTASVVEAFTILQKWAKNNWLPNGVMGLDPTQVEAEFLGGKGAMALDGQWIEQTLVPGKMPASAYGTFIPPTDQTPLRFSGFTEGLFITTESSKDGEAEELLNYYTKVSSQRLDQNAYTTVKAVPSIPGYVGTAQWKTWLAEQPHYIIQDQSLSTSLANSYFNIQSNVVQGSQSPAAAAAAMQQAVEQSKSGS